MSPEFILSLLMISFVVFFSLGVPLAFSLLFSSITVIILDPNLDIIILPQRIFAGMNNILLLAIPGFMFSALMMNRIGITQDIVKLSDLLVGRIRGGLAHVNVVSSMLMGGVSGSSTADVAGIGAIMIPSMNQKGYSKGFSVSLTAASSAIGSIVPPSILMIIYGASANVSIAALFLAGYLPGILVGLQQLVITYIYARKNNLLDTSEKIPAKEKIKILLRGLVPVSVIVVILGGILGGIMTATESAAVASVYVVLLGIFFYRKINFKMLIEVAVETAQLTAVVMICVGTATIFGWLLSYYYILDVVSGLFQSFSTDPTVFLLFVAILFLVLGTFMDPAPAMLIFVPVLTSIASNVGANPIQMGILVIMALAIGKITPPYGISLLLACTIGKIKLADSMNWALVFFLCFCVLMLLVVLLPSLTLFIPKLFVPDLI